MFVKNADPFILFDKKTNTYYSYSTSDYNNLHFLIHKSSNLYEWEFVGYAYDDLDDNNIGKDWFWAPECYYNENNGYYYLFYSTRIKDNLLLDHFCNTNFQEGCKICVSISKSPCGPFKNIVKGPLDYYPYDQFYIDRTNNKKGTYIPCIDVNLLFDDKNIYLYCSRNCYKNDHYDQNIKAYIEESIIIGVELESEWWYSKTPIMPKIKKEYLGFKGDSRQDKFVRIIDYQNIPQGWENNYILNIKRANTCPILRRWHEGSTTFVLNIENKKKYCLLYSSNSFEGEDYSVGIAFSDNPLGPYIKYKNNPIITKSDDNAYNSVGHGSIIFKDGDTYYIHHGRHYKSDRYMIITKMQIQTIDDIKIISTNFASLI